MSDSNQNADKINASIAALDAQRAALGDAVVDSAIAALRQQLSQSPAGAEKSQAEDERKIVTIVFADVSGFTALAEKKDPEEVRGLINACFEKLVPIVQKYGGTIDKFIGDEIMALFGAPIAHEDDPERALRAALEMMEAINDVNRDYGTELGMHIGINTGRVVAGAVGAQDRRQYSVMGDAVNLAARLEDASNVGEIFVGPSTHRATATLFKFKPMSSLQLKGKQAPVAVHRLIGAKSKRISRRGIEGLHAPLTGRDAELEQIRRSIAQLNAGRGCMMSILGEAGLGKSRLVSEARALARSALWAEGRALSYTSGRSYWVARDLVLNLLALTPDAPAATIADGLKRDLQKSVDGTATEIFPYLARMLELPLAEEMEERVQFLSGEALQARMLEAFRNYVRAHAINQPLVLVWEDLHWSDPSSLQLLEAIAPLASNAPLLLICVSRIEETRPVKLLTRMVERCAPNSVRLELRSLDNDESSALIHGLLKIDNLPAQLRDLITKRAEGNPFYIEELLRALLDTGAIALGADGPKLMRTVEAVDVPETLNEVLSARIDRLDAADKTTLQKASVIGRIFDRAVLLQLHNGSSESKLDQALDELVRRQFIQSREQTGSETSALRADEFIFKHAITHDVAYNSMLFARRKELHKLVAEAIEELFPERLDDLCATLGFHFERAEAHEQAINYLGRAAERAKATFANTEAIGFYESAIHAVEQFLQSRDSPEYRKKASRLNEALGDVLTLKGEHDAARAAYDRAQFYRGNWESVPRSRLFLKIGFCHNTQRQYQPAGSAYDAADKELGDIADSCSGEWWEQKVQIQLERMHLFYWQGKASEMQTLAENIRSVVELRGTPLQRGKFFEKLALSHLTGSRYRPTKECLELAELAVSKSRESDNLSEISHIRFVLGFVHLWRRNFVDAIRYLKEAHALGERCGNLVVQARCLIYLSVAQRDNRDLDEARIWAERALELARKLAMIEYVAMAKANLAWVAWKEMRLDECEKLAHEALELWHGMEDPYSFDWMALWPLIATALAQNKTEDAIRLAEGLFPDNQHPIDDEVMSATREAIDSWTSGNRSSAESQIENALKTAEQHHYI